MNLNLFRIAALCTAAALSGCATLPPDDPADPLEPFNRAMFSFNLKADHYVLKPVAKGYDAVTPTFVKRSLINFFGNLGEPVTIINGVLQGKFAQAGSDTGRFLLNSTAGIGGLMDVATKTGLEPHSEDFGQTLGHYGIGTGVYLMLPLLGPSNGRDAIGRAADYFSNPLYYVQENNGDLDPLFYSLTGLNLISTRTQFFSADSLIDSALDPYIFVRTAYLQNRLNKVYDGDPPKSLLYGDEDE